MNYLICCFYLVPSHDADLMMIISKSLRNIEYSLLGKLPQSAWNPMADTVKAKCFIYQREIQSISSRGRIVFTCDLFGWVNL